MSPRSSVAVTAAWPASVDEERRARWERRGLVEHGNAYLVATCRVCAAREEVYTLDALVAVEVLVAQGWGFEERGLQPWLWSCREH